MAKWRDISSYSRSDTDRTPRTWQIKLGAYTLVVTRHIRYPGTWLATCEPLFNQYDMGTDDVSKAKREALVLVQTRLQVALDDSMHALANDA